MLGTRFYFVASVPLLVTLLIVQESLAAPNPEPLDVAYEARSCTPIQLIKELETMTEGCQNQETKGADYTGTADHTKYGTICQKWSSQKPHKHKFEYVGDHNYCRNPDNAHSVWCFTTDPDQRWQYCGVPWCGGGDEGLLNIAQLSVDPYPVVVASGSSFSLAVTIDLLKEVAVGTSIKLKIVKEGLIDFPLPCLDLNGTPVGSCEYDGDFLLAAADEALCQGGYFPDGQECKLPLAPGQYGGGDPLSITLPDDLPDLIINLLASGTYRVEIHANNGGSEMVCAWVRLELHGA